MAGNHGPAKANSLVKMEETSEWIVVFCIEESLSLSLSHSLCLAVSTLGFFSKRMSAKRIVGARDRGRVREQEREGLVVE